MPKRTTYCSIMRHWLMTVVAIPLEMFIALMPEANTRIVEHDDELGLWFVDDDHP